MKRYHFFKFFVVTLMIGFFSPSLTLKTASHNGLNTLSFSLLSKAEARRGGGMRGGGMRRGGGGMRRSGGMRSNRMRSPRSNRYQGGNFSQGKTNSFGLSTARTRPSTRPAKRPSTKPSTRPVKRPTKSQAKQAIKDRRASGGKKISNGSFRNNQDERQTRRKDRREDRRDNRHDHDGYYGGGYYGGGYYGGGYYGGFGYYGGAMLTGMAIGTIVTVLPETECEDLVVGDNVYKECSGTLYKPVYKDGEVQYKIVESEI